MRFKHPEIKKDFVKATSSPHLIPIPGFWQRCQGSRSAKHGQTRRMASHRTLVVYNPTRSSVQHRKQKAILSDKMGLPAHVPGPLRPKWPQPAPLCNRDITEADTACVVQILLNPVAAPGWHRRGTWGHGVWGLLRCSCQE